MRKKELDKKTRFYLVIIYARMFSEIIVIIGFFIIIFLLMNTKT